MRKHITKETAQPTDSGSATEWLAIEQIAEVEITSEKAEWPIESALLAGQEAGWRAAEPGVQRVRLRFDMPRHLHRIRLRFDEPTATRTQEFVLRYSLDDHSFHEIVRQQWTFSPQGSTSEIEEYQVELSGVMAIELVIVPNISGGEDHATLAEWCLA